MTTIGEFLQEKVMNMLRWLQAEDCPGNLTRDITQLEATTLAELLASEHQLTIRLRDFEALLADKENMPSELLSVLDFVKSKHELHDKFWRYLALFSDTVLK